MYKLFLIIISSLALVSNSFGAVNAMQVQLETAGNGRQTVSRLLTEGTALVGDSSNVPQVTDIVTQTELTSSLASYLTIASAASLYQPLDSDLTTLAALTTTSYGRALLELSNSAALRTAAGLVIGTDVQAFDVDLSDLADGSLTGTKVGFADTDSNFVATDIQSAIEELDNVNASGPNATDGKIEWSQLVGVPAGLADGTDDGSGGGSGTMSITQEGGVQVGDADIVTLNFGSGFDLAESPDTKISVSLDASEVFTGGDLSWSGNTPSVGANSIALGTDTTGNYVATIADSGATEITVTGSGAESAAVTLAIAASIARDAEVAAAYQPLDTDLTAIAGLDDPNADRFLGWDDSEGAYKYFSAGTGLTFSGTSVSVNLGDTIESSEITDGTIVNADISGSAAISASKVADVGNTKFGSRAGPITTNPYAPTWTTQDAILYYGATGEVDLPAAASYTNKSLVIWSTGTFTITVDPNGSELIIASGASLGAGTADTISGTAGLSVLYVSDGTSWIKYTGGSGSGVASLTPWTENINGGGFDLTNVQDITATTVSADLSGSTGIPGSEITGPIADLTYGQIKTSEALVHTPTAGVSNVIVTTDTVTTITLDDVAETLTYSGVPETGTRFSYVLTGHTSDCTVTIPSTYSDYLKTNRTSFIVKANTIVTVAVERRASSYVMFNEPIEISTLPEDTTPATTAKVEIDQGNGAEQTSIANIRDAVGTTFNGSAAAPNSDTPEAVSFNTLTFYHFCGGTQELDLPAAAGYVGRGIVIRFDGSYVVTCDPNGSEVIDLDGTAMSAGEALIVTGTAGQVAVLVSDGTSWLTSGGNAAYTQETP